MVEHLVFSHVLKDHLKHYLPHYLFLLLPLMLVGVAVLRFIRNRTRFERL
jgi:hypothetical protein